MPLRRTPFVPVTLATLQASGENACWDCRASKQAAAAGGLAKAKVRESERKLQGTINERLEHALEAAHIGIWDWYPQTNVLIASRTAQDLLGYAPGEFPETIDAYWSRLHADDRERVEAAMRAVLKPRDEGTAGAFAAA